MAARMGYPVIAVLAGISLFTVAAAATKDPPAAAKDDDVVAKLDGADVKISDLRTLIEGLDPAMRREAAQNPKLLVQLVRSAVGRLAVLEEARKQSWENKPQVAAQIEQARRDVVIASYLRARAEPPDAYPSDKDVQEAYDANRERFMLPRQYHLAQIFVALPAGADANAAKAAEAKARDLARKAKEKKADFAALATAGSDDKASAARGGDFGWAGETQILPEIRAAVQGLGDGEVSEPIRTKSGWHIVQMIGTKPATVQPLDEARPALVAGLRQQKVVQNEQAYLNDLLAKDHVAINEIAADKLIHSLK